jgi:dGTPase
MEWDRLLSRDRLGRENESAQRRPGRSEFDSDVGRLTFSGTFRRLGRKTQVHPLAPNDHVHTRLTHTMEVAYVGRALGKELGQRISTDLPKGYSAEDLGTIVHAACLAHDMGNPPFGHGGEEGMSHWFETNGPSVFENLSNDYKRDLISVEGNAQGFRIVGQTENHLFDGGLQLTYATLGAFHKYPWTSRKGEKKFGSFLSEEDLLNRIGEKLGLVSTGTSSWCRHPLAHLVEAADDICYSIIDLEDDGAEKKKIRKEFASGPSHRVNLARLRGHVFDKAISTAIAAYMDAYPTIMAGGYDGNIFDLLEPADPTFRMIYGAKALGRKQVYNDIKKIEMEIGCYAIFDVLLKEFCAAALNQAVVLNDKAKEAALSWKSGHVLKLLGDHAPAINNGPPGGWSSYQCLRRMIDFVMGMTDNYAVYISRQLQGMAFAGVQRP